MKFTFFTLGGKQFWEDLFFYQGWRIQRSCISGKYRLLDNWNIRRESGTLLHCQNAFIHYIDVYQLLQPKQKAVVFIHGFGQSKEIFAKMALSFEKEGFTAIPVNYPSLCKNFSGIVEQFEFLLNNLKDIQEISFIAQGVGGLILRKLLARQGNWQRKIKLGRIVAIDPPNQGLRIGEILSESKWKPENALPLANIYKPEEIEMLPDFPKNIEVGILTSWNPLARFVIGILPASWRQNFPSARDSYINTAKDIGVIKYFRLNHCSSTKTIIACLNFIKKGKFKSVQKIKKL